MPTETKHTPSAMRAAERAVYANHPEATKRDKETRIERVNKVAGYIDAEMSTLAAENAELRASKSAFNRLIDIQIVRLQDLTDSNTALVLALESCATALRSGHPVVQGDTTIYPLEGALVGNALNAARSALAAARKLGGKA